jgi:hypothetical protein
MSRHLVVQRSTLPFLAQNISARGGMMSTATSALRVGQLRAARAHKAAKIDGRDQEHYRRRKELCRDADAV